MKAALTAKLKQGRPVTLTAEEADYLVEALRAAMAVVLEVPPEKIADDTRVFDDLGLDSIDVFDLLDQLAEQFEVQVILEEMPESFLRGGEDTTFCNFAQGLLRYFSEPPGKTA